MSFCRNAASRRPERWARPRRVVLPARAPKHTALPEATPPKATGLPRRARTPKCHGNPHCHVPRPSTHTRRALPAPARAAPPPYVLLPAVAAPSVPLSGTAIRVP
jgi:hypothetical protein